MDAAQRRRLASVAGNTAVDGDGAVHPANVQQVRELLAMCAAEGLRVVPASTASPGATTVAISADRLDAIRLDASTLLLHVGAASTWQAARESAAGSQLAISALGAMRSDHVGASVAAGEVAHRTIVGIDLLTRTGELISAGGRTLKDVVGYDLPGLALGSGDRLGLILALTLRLEPAGARTAAVPGPGRWRGDAGLDVASAFGS